MKRRAPYPFTSARKVGCQGSVVVAKSTFGLKTSSQIPQPRFQKLVPMTMPVLAGAVDSAAPQVTSASSRLLVPGQGSPKRKLLVAMRQELRPTQRLDT